jgi:hypothetical protein
MTKMGNLRAIAALLMLLGVIETGETIGMAAGGGGKTNESFKVLAPIESGNLVLFPVVRNDGKSSGTESFLTLDEGIKSGQVEVTEAGRAQGLVRSRGGQVVADGNRLRGDQVNTLVLLNHSKQPLLLLAGEIVTGGKQDRVIAKDRIVPAGSDPIDLSVFCIEPGRWTGSSSSFGATAKMPSGSFMVQPTVRQQAMVAKDQQQVWNAVGGAISHLSVAAAPPASTPGPRSFSGNAMGTTSYAKAMQDSAVSSKVDEAAAPIMRSRDQVLAQLRQEHAVGVVAAVRGEIVWADIFADTELLSRYWMKLVRSYAAESLDGGETHAAPTMADAQHFLETPSTGAENTEGQVGVYRYREINSGNSETFVLESLLPPTSYELHISILKLKNPDRRMRAGAVP